MKTLLMLAALSILAISLKSFAVDQSVISYVIDEDIKISKQGKAHQVGVTILAHGILKSASAAVLAEKVINDLMKPKKCIFPADVTDISYPSTDPEENPSRTLVFASCRAQ